MDEPDQDKPEAQTGASVPALSPARGRRPAANAPIRRREIRPLPEFTGLMPGGDMDGRYAAFLPAALQIIQTPPAKSRRVAVYVFCGGIVAALVWSFFFNLRLFAIAPGEFQPKGGSQVVQSLEPGQVKAVAVKNGDRVKRDALLLQLDPTSALAAKTIIESKLVNARAESIRRAAAVLLARAPKIDKDAPISWPSDIPADVKQREERVLHADLTQLAATLADFAAKLKVQESLKEKFAANIVAQKTLVDSRTQRSAMHEKLAEMGRDSRATVLQSLEPLRQDQVTLAGYEGSLAEAEAQIPVVKSEMAQARDEFVATNTDKAADADRQVDDLTQQLKKAGLVLDKLAIRAPVAGTVHSLAVTSIGQSLKAGELLMRIVPEGVPLEVQAYVLNTDIGFVKLGQPVILKVDTFPFTRYGTIKGKVTHVGADAITGAYAVALQKNDATTPSKGSMSATNAAQQMSDLVFPITVVPEKTTMRVDGREVPFAPGMSVVAEIETARQRVISYILYPLTRVFAKSD